MSTEYASWAEVKAKGQDPDPRSEPDQPVGKAVARERREAYVRGHQFAEMRKTAGLTQAQLAAPLGVSQARISKIEYGEIPGIEVIRATSPPLAATSTSSPPSATALGESPDLFVGKPSAIVADCYT